MHLGTLSLRHSGTFFTQNLTKVKKKPLIYLAVKIFILFLQLIKEQSDMILNGHHHHLHFLLQIG